MARAALCACASEVRTLFIFHCITCNAEEKKRKNNDEGNVSMQATTTMKMVDYFSKLLTMTIWVIESLLFDIFFFKSNDLLSNFVIEVYFFALSSEWKLRFMFMIINWTSTSILIASSLSLDVDDGIKKIRRIYFSDRFSFLTKDATLLRTFNKNCWQFSMLKKSLIFFLYKISRISQTDKLNAILSAIKVQWVQVSALIRKKNLMNSIAFATLRWIVGDKKKVK